MTSQQFADEVLARWWELDGLRPDDRMQIIMEDFFTPPLSHDVRYEETLHKLSEIMADD